MYSQTNISIPPPQSPILPRPDCLTTLPIELQLQIYSQVFGPWSATTVTEGRVRDNVLHGAPARDLLLVSKRVHDIAALALRDTFSGVLTLSHVDKADYDGGVQQKSVFDDSTSGFVKWIAEHTKHIKARGYRGMSGCGATHITSAFLLQRGCVSRTDLWLHFPTLKRLELTLDCYIPDGILYGATDETLPAMWQELLENEFFVELWRISASQHLVRLLQRGTALKVHLVGYRIVRDTRTYKVYEIAKPNRRPIAVSGMRVIF